MSLATLGHSEVSARFQAKKRQDEKDAAAPEASKGDPLPTTSSPREPGPSTFTFGFAEPTPENMSADSNFANMNVDGNATISKEYVSQTNPVDFSESNSSDPASREQKSSKEIVSSGPVPRKNDSSEMNSSDTELRPQCPPPPGWKVPRDENRTEEQIKGGN